MPFSGLGSLRRSASTSMIEHEPDPSASPTFCLLMEWILTNPEVPDGPWCKDFGAFKLAVEGALPKTFLTKGQACTGTVV
jgi:hypothetical protein